MLSGEIELNENYIKITNDFELKKIDKIVFEGKMFDEKNKLITIKKGKFKYFIN